jgi:hypothetical protein
MTRYRRPDRYLVGIWLFFAAAIIVFLASTYLAVQSFLELVG